MNVHLNEAKPMTRAKEEQFEAELSAAAEAAAKNVPLQEARSLTEQFAMRNSFDAQLRTTISRKRVVLNYEYDVQRSELQLKFERERKELALKYEKQLRELDENYTTQTKELDTMLRKLGE